MEAKFNLFFLWGYLQSLAHMLFQRKLSKDLGTEIVAVKETLAYDHKALQDL